MALTQTVLTKALDNALVALALGNAHNVDLVACCEDISLQHVANVHCGNIFQTELAQGLLGGNVCLLEVTCSCLVDLLGGNLAEAQLNSLIAIALDSLLLHDGAGACLDDGDGDDLAVSSNSWVIPTFLPIMPLTIFFSSCKGYWLAAHVTANMTPRETRASEFDRVWFTA